jgi:hypothetical protein
MEAAGPRVSEIDWLGASGGQLAVAFGAGCVATWGFIQTVLVGPLKKQIRELKDECEKRDERSAQRINQLETLLLLHGPGQLRQQLQAALSEERVLGDKG